VGKGKDKHRHKGKGKGDDFGHFMGGSQAQFMSIEQVRNAAIEKMLQKETSAPWEQKLLDIHYQEFDKLRNMDANLTNIAQNQKGQVITD